MIEARGSGAAVSDRGSRSSKCDTGLCVDLLPNSQGDFRNLFRASLCIPESSFEMESCSRDSSPSPSVLCVESA